MCGIAGFVDFRKAMSQGQMEVIAGQMALTLSHRGPNHQGVWVDEKRGVALSHRRLSIIDCSPLGQQPMHSRCERYTIIYNGEIYNFKTLRTQLSRLGYSYKSHSDTEVLLSAFSQWGVPITLEQINGMFAIALYDHKEACLYLIRDRMGQKPLYYARFGSYFLFASELKALLAHPNFEKKIDHHSLRFYTRYNYVPTPRSIYCNTFKLSQGHYLKISLDEEDEFPAPVCYWSHQRLALLQQHCLRQDSFDSVQQELHDLLKTAVSMRMVSDVPLGAFLSGGIDSSLVVALMQAQATTAVKTFTIGFEDPAFNEANEARAVAQHLGTDHTELYLSSHEAQAVIPDLPTVYDEPFADSSQIPTFLVAKLARQQVTVALSGDGGDESFAGYARYVMAPQLWSRFMTKPKLLKKVLTKLIACFPKVGWQFAFRLLNQLGFYRSVGPDVNSKIERFLSILNCDTFKQFYLELLSVNPCWQRLLLVDEENNKSVDQEGIPQQFSTDRLSQMLWLDTFYYLPDDILTKVDRATMSVSLEMRSPFLDYRVVEFAWALPEVFKLQRQSGKRILKSLLSHYLPAVLIDRPKRGFGIPLHNWLRSPGLRSWAGDLLNVPMLRRQGFFNPDLISQTWKEYQSGRNGQSSLLWNVLMFQAWYSQYMQT